MAPVTLSATLSFAEGAGAVLGESPVFDQDDTVWWVDIVGRRLNATLISSRATRSWETPEMPGFVVLTAPGRPVVGMQSGLFAFSPDDGGFERIVRFDGDDERFNDATVDAQGRLWASTMCMKATPGRGTLKIVTADLQLKTVVTGLSIPNGLAADIDAGRLCLSDSHPAVRTIWTVDCDFHTGEIGDRRIFATMTDGAGRPDGAALSTGSDIYWIAAVDGGALVGFDATGSPAFKFPLPFPAPTKLCFLPNGIAVTAKAEGEYDGRLAFAEPPLSPLRGPAMPFWSPGGA